MLVKKNIQIVETDTILNDDYPVYCGYSYLVDGNLHCSDVGGTVRDLRRSVFNEFGKADEVRKYTIYAERTKTEVPKEHRVKGVFYPGDTAVCKKFIRFICGKSHKYNQEIKVTDENCGYFNTNSQDYILKESK